MSDIILYIDSFPHSFSIMVQNMTNVFILQNRNRLTNIENRDCGI